MGVNNKTLLKIFTYYASKMPESSFKSSDFGSEKGTKPKNSEM